jgi:hypothetical protein
MDSTKVRVDVSDEPAMKLTTRTAGFSINIHQNTRRHISKYSKFHAGRCDNLRFDADSTERHFSKNTEQQQAMYVRA